VSVADVTSVMSATAKALKPSARRISAYDVPYMDDAEVMTRVGPPGPWVGSGACASAAAGPSQLQTAAQNDGAGGGIGRSRTAALAAGLQIASLSARASALSSSRGIADELFRSDGDALGRSMTARLAPVFGSQTVISLSVSPLISDSPSGAKSNPLR